MKFEQTYGEITVTDDRFSMQPTFNNVADAYRYASSNNCRLSLENEKLIAANPSYSYFYSNYVLHSRFELGEKAISEDIQSSYWYARDVLKSRFKLGEKTISTSTDYSYRYAYDVLKSRFKLGEKSVSVDSFCSCFYAIDILKSRFELGEKVVAKSSHAPTYINEIFNGNPPVDFLEHCPINILEYLLTFKNINSDNIIKILFKKKILI